VAPLAYIVEHIGGEHVVVETLLTGGQDPHLFEPTPRQIQKLSKADLYLSSGLPFERILLKKTAAQNQTLTIADATRDIAWLKDDHHHGSDFAHNNTDPHFWLGTHQLEQFIHAAAQIISQADPNNAEKFKQNSAILLQRLKAVHTRNLLLLKPYRGATLFVYHPAFTYFTHEYGLKQQAVETHGRQPGPRTIASLISQAQAAGARTIFVQPQFDSKTAQTIAAAINGHVVTIDPLAKNVIQNLEIIAGQIEQSFKKK
jgi:zinc transport system substrate-binding protein